MQPAEPKLLSLQRGEMQLPFFAHGVSFASLIAFAGAACVFTLSTAACKSGTILFMPAMTMTFSGPNSIAETLFDLASTSYNSPCIVIAFADTR